MTLDNGGRTSWGATTPWISMRTFSSLYRVPHVRQHVDVIYTNNIYACAFRGYGNPQATFALESQIDQLAEKLGLDPLKIRLINAQEPGVEPLAIEVIPYSWFPDCWPQWNEAE